MSANSFQSSAEEFHIPLSTSSIDLYSISESFSQNHLPVFKRPRFRTPSPGRSLRGSEVKERLDFFKNSRIYQKEMGKQGRKVSDRFRKFLEHWADKCRQYNKVSKESERQTLTTDIVICENEIKSRWEELHGNAGLVPALLKSISKIQEVRFYLQYGDYLADSLVKLKNECFTGYYWKQYNLNWVEVSEQLEREEELMEVWRKNGRDNEIPKTPLMDDVHQAAAQSSMTPKELTWEIHAYARRNLMAHSNMKHLINHCEWRNLAERICNDLATLHRIYPGRGSDQIEMRRTIKNFQSQYFNYICRSVTGEIIFELNTKAEALDKNHKKHVLEQSGSQMI